jgi:hypothetical protein
MRLRFDCIHRTDRILVQIRSGRQLQFDGIDIPEAAKAKAGCVRYRPGIGTHKSRDGGCFMIEVLKNFPNNVVAIFCEGQVTREDYEGVFVPAILKALKLHDKIRLLYHISANFTGYDPGAIWEDLKIGVEHPTRWERAAVVTDVDWIVQTMYIFSFLMPCPTKVFPPSELAQAHAWIVAAS